MVPTVYPTPCLMKWWHALLQTQIKQLASISGYILHCLQDSLFILWKLMKYNFGLWWFRALYSPGRNVLTRGQRQGEMTLYFLTVLFLNGKVCQWRKLHEILKAGKEQSLWSYESAWTHIRSIYSLWVLKFLSLLILLWIQHPINILRHFIWPHLDISHF